MRTANLLGLNRNILQKTKIFNISAKQIGSNFGDNKNKANYILCNYFSR